MPADRPARYLGHALDRRRFLGLGAAAAAGLLAAPFAAAQRRDSIHDLRGTVRVNGQAIDRAAVIRPGDTVLTTSDGYVVFTIGDDAFMLRERSELRIESAAGDAFVGALRLVTGALGAAFGRRSRGTVRIVAPTVTAGIRGTACYLETRGEGTYFCTCHGRIELDAAATAGTTPMMVSTRRHDSPYMVLAQPREGTVYQPASFETHTDDEIDMLERCVDRRAPWVAR